MSYDFSQLSSLDFEELCCDLLQQQEGIRYELFKPGRDQGIDARYLNGESTTIVQCKHYLRSGLKKLRNVLIREEYEKIKKLNPSRYIVMTSVSLSANNKREIQQLLQPYIRSQSDIFGQEDVNNLLSLYPRIEQKHFKLWLSSTAILKRMLHNDVFVQSEQLVERAKRKLPIYVQNDSFFEAKKIVDKYRMVIVSGEPGVGKTTLAEMLVLAHIKRGFQPIEVRNPKEAYKIHAFNQKIIYYFDDFLGLTYLGDNPYVEKLTETVNFIDLIRGSRDSRIIFTSREYIIAQAQLKHERFASIDFLNEKYKLCLSAYTQAVRAKILYNHLYFSDLENEYLEALVSSKTYREIVAHRNYRPRIISWLTEARRLKKISKLEYPNYFLETLKNPREIWVHAFEQISISARNILLTLLSLGASSYSSILRQASESFLDYYCQKYRLCRTYDDYHHAITELVGSFLKVESDQILFHDPSVKDFLEDYVAHRTEILKDILESAKNLRQIFEIWKFSKISRISAENTISASDVGSSILNLEINTFSIENQKIESRIIDAAELRYIQALEFLLEIYEETREELLKNIILSEINQAREMPRKVFGMTIEWVKLARKIKEKAKNGLATEDILQEIDKLVMQEIDKPLSLHMFAYLVDVSRDKVLPSLDIELCELLLLDILERGDFYKEIEGINNSSYLNEYLLDLIDLSSCIDFDDTPLVNFIELKMESLRDQEGLWSEAEYYRQKEVESFEQENREKELENSEEKSIEDYMDSMFQGLLEN